MSKKLITTLVIVAIAIVSCIVLVGGIIGYVYYTGNLDHNPERPKGELFGQSTDQKGCLEESLRRVREDPENGFFERHAKSHLPSFMTGCLQTATPTKEFCDGVPKLNEVFWALDYVQQQCKKRGLDEKVGCTNVFRRVIKACDSHKLKVVSYPQNN